MTLSPNLNGAEVRMYGTHSFNLTGTSGNDTIHDYTNIAASATNIIHGGDGNDSIVAHNNTLGTELVYGDGGSDTLVGGANAQLFGGDGADTLLAYGGAAALSGGAGNDVLLNSYAANYGAANSTAKAVTMIGGSGNDTFGVMGTNAASASGSMKSIVADLGTGDSIDLSFLEKTTGGVSNDVSISSTSDLSGGKATMNTAGTTLTLTSFVATSSEANTGLTDVNSQTTGGTMTISNATLTKAAAAITAGMGTLGLTNADHSAIDFNSTFGHLTDTYSQY
jgi:Ca2+-binding RTX toxin-like protein